MQRDNLVNWELEQPTSSFDAALKALTGGIGKRNMQMPGFPGVYLDRRRVEEPLAVA
jgi:hypothetical protein